MRRRIDQKQQAFEFERPGRSELFDRWRANLKMHIIWHCRLKPAEKALIRILFNYTGTGGRFCWPSYETLAIETGFSRRHVIRVMSRLADLRTDYRRKFAAAERVSGNE